MPSVSTGNPSLVSQNTGPHTVTYTFSGGWGSNTANHIVYDRRMFVNGGQLFDYVSGSLTDVAGNYSGNGTVAADANNNCQAQIKFDIDGTLNGNLVNFKSSAEDASASSPTVGTITQTSAVVSCDFIPRVNASVATAQLQYKRTVDSTWIDFGTPKTDGTGYGTVSISSISLTGLLAGTSYDVRLKITRTTVNSTLYTGPATSFNTLPGIPSVTTNEASVVTANTAHLNGTIAINAGTTVQVYFKYGTDNPPTQFTTTPQSVSADGTFGDDISGLSDTTTYYAQAFATFATPPGSPVNGSVVTFNTPTDPAAEAAEEAHVIIREFNERKYGVASKFIFTVASPAATSSDRFFNAASPFVAGDVTVAQDTGSGLGAFANVTSLPTRIGSTPAFELDLSATEMQGKTVVVMVVDQNGPAFRDMMFVIRTYQELGAIDVDASQLTDVSAMKLTGQGAGHGLEAVGGATGRDYDGIMAQHFQRVSACQTNVTGTVVKLDAGASATDDYYKGSIVVIVEGTGAGQSRVIISYNGTSKEATIDTAWSTIPTAGSVALIIGGDRPWDLSPATELATVPGATASYGLKLQFLFQRFAFKITQTATLQTWFKSNSSTTLATRSVDDDGVTQLLSKLT